MKFSRYIAVQCVAYGLDMGVFLTIFWLLGIGSIGANAVGKIVAGIFAFFAHRSFTFGIAIAEQHGRQILRYFLLLALNIPLSSAVLSLFLLAVPSPVIAKFSADVVLVIATYWLSKRYVFSAAKTDCQKSLPQERIAS